MPERMPRTKIYRIERLVKGLGRYRISSGTASKTEWGRRNAIVTKLIEAGEGGVNTLRLLKEGVISWPELVDADDAGKLREMAKQVLLLRPLQQTFEDWVSTHTSRRRGRALAPNTKDHYRDSWQRFTQRATELKLLPKEGAVIADLQRLDWANLRAHRGASGYDWNNFRIALSAFLNSALNRSLDRYRAEIMRVLPPAERFTKRGKPLLSPVEFWTVLAHAPEPYQASFLAMLVLSAGPNAYTGIGPADLDHAQHIVRIPDDKNEYRERYVKVPARLWPWIVAAVPAPAGDQMLRRRWKDAVKAARIPRRVKLYTLRNLSGQFASKGGVPVQEISLHMGHSNVEMTMEYLEGMEVEAPAEAIADVLLRAAPPTVLAMLPPPTASTEQSGDQA